MGYSVVLLALLVQEEDQPFLVAADNSDHRQVKRGENAGGHAHSSRAESI